MLEGKLRDSALQRLHRIAGQVRGLERMVEQQRYCIEIVQQIAAVEAALHRLSAAILENHMQTCVADAFATNDPSVQREKIEELIRVFHFMRRG